MPNIPDSTEVLSNAILGVLMVHYLGSPSRTKVMHALDALATAAGRTIGGLDQDQHRMRVYFVMKLGESIEQAREWGESLDDTGQRHRS